MGVGSRGAGFQLLGAGNTSWQLSSERKEEKLVSGGAFFSFPGLGCYINLPYQPFREPTRASFCLIIDTCRSSTPDQDWVGSFHNSLQGLSPLCLSKGHIGAIMTDLSAAYLSATFNLLSCFQGAISCPTIPFCYYTTVYVFLSLEEPCIKFSITSCKGYLVITLAKYSSANCINNHLGKMISGF